MKILGYYEEFWPTEAGVTHRKLADSTHPEPAPDGEAVCDYLRAGHVLFSAMGVVGDALGSTERIAGGDAILTDGDWIWRGDLWFYVHTYHVRLPSDFLALARERDHTVPAVDPGRLAELTREIRTLL